jgi:hypothetical protein
MIIGRCPSGPEILDFALPAVVSYGVMYNECPGQMGGGIETNQSRRLMPKFKK